MATFLRNKHDFADILSALRFDLTYNLYTVYK